MVKEHEFLAAVRSQNLLAVQKYLQKVGKPRGLLGSSKQRKLNINCQDIEGMTSIHHASFAGNLQMLIYLLESGGAHPDVHDAKGLRPLHYASSQGHLEAARLLLEWGAAPDRPAFDGTTPLHAAARNGHPEVVKLLMCYQVEVTTRNHQGYSSLELACEYGHFSIVEVLLSSGKVQHELYLDESITKSSCLHLAAKRGHVDLLRFLLHQPGVNINRQIPQGTVLHIAAMNSHHAMVKMLIELGIDINRLNSFEQTAADLISKSVKGSKELRQLLKEAGMSVSARAVKDFCDVRNPSNITFRDGDAITVLEQCSDGMWKGYVTNQGISRAGFFPASCVSLVENKGHQGTPQHQACMTSSLGSNSEFREQTRQQNLMPQKESLPYPEWTSNGGSGSGSSSGTVAGTSNRNSAASVDSGRSSAHTVGSESGRLPVLMSSSVPPTTSCPHRSSLQSMESGVIGCRQSCVSSSSSSSLGSSVEHLESGENAQMIGLSDLRARGMRDEEIMQIWLTQLQLGCYWERLIQAGYDLFTMSRMTPEDLNAVGVTNPKHRKKLKSEMSRFYLIDALPDYIPESVSDWLKLLNFPEYSETLSRQGYINMDQLLELTWEDLEEIGIHKLGHQKKLILAVDRLKRIKRGHLDLASSSQPLYPATPTRHQPSTLAPCCVQRWPYPCLSPAHNTSNQMTGNLPDITANQQQHHHVMVHTHPQSSMSMDTHQVQLRSDHVSYNNNMNQCSIDSKPGHPTLSQLRGLPEDKVSTSSPSHTPSRFPLLHTPPTTRPSAVVAPNNCCPVAPSTPQPLRPCSTLVKGPGINSLERPSLRKKVNPPPPPKRITSILQTPAPPSAPSSTCMTPSSTSNQVSSLASHQWLVTSSGQQGSLTLPESELTAALMPSIAMGQEMRTCSTTPSHSMKAPGNIMTSSADRPLKSGSNPMTTSADLAGISSDCLDEGDLKSRSSSQMSVDSIQSLPFANENCGTIKQRTTQSGLDLAGEEWMRLPGVHLPYDTSSLRRGSHPNETKKAQPSLERRAVPPPTLPKPVLTAAQAQANAESRVRLPNLEADSNSSTGGDFDNICDMLEDLTDMLDREIKHQETGTPYHSMASTSSSSPAQTASPIVPQPLPPPTPS